MPTYRLSKTVSPDRINSGEQIGIIARPRTADTTRRHAVGGQPLTLRIATSSKPSEDIIFPVMTCSAYVEVIFTPEGLGRVLHAQPVHPGTIERIHALLVNAEPSSVGDKAEANAKLARALGFDTYADLWKAHGNDKLKMSVRVVLGWLPATAAAEQEGAA